MHKNDFNRDIPGNLTGIAEAMGESFLLLQRFVGKPESTRPQAGVPDQCDETACRKLC